MRCWLPYILTLLFQIGLLGNTLYSQNLMAHYQMDGDASDSSGNSNHGVINGGVESTTDRWGNPCGALSFNGTDGFISVPSSPTLELPYTEFSTTAWFRLNRSTDPSYKWLTLVCKGDSPTEVVDNPNYRVQVLQAHNQSTVSISTAFTEFDDNHMHHQIPLGEWIFVALTYDGSRVQLYFNAVKVWEFAYAKPFSSNNAPLHIARDIPGAEEFFYGSLDDLRLFDSALSKQDIKFLFKDNSGSQFQQTESIECQESITSTTDYGSCGAVIHYDSPVSNSNCGQSDVKLVRGLDSGSFFPLGNNKVVFLVTEGSGQRQACEFSIKVNDAEPPSLICPMDTVLWINSRLDSIEYYLPEPIASDNCALRSVELMNSNTSDFFKLGKYEFTYVATDESGNQSTCDFWVSVELNSPEVVDDTVAIAHDDLKVSGLLSDSTEMHQDTLDTNDGLLDERALDLQHEMLFDDCEIKALIFDGSKQDRDTVSIFFNDELIVDKQMLRTKRNGAFEVDLVLNPSAENLLVSYAWNTGQLGPNTLKIEFYQGKMDITKKPVATKKIHSTLGSSGAISLFCN